MSSWVLNPWYLGVGLGLVALASWAASGAILRLLIAWRVYDQPNHRSSHAEAKPRGGGLAVVAVVLAAWVTLAVSTPAASPAVWQVIAGAVVLGAISWADDLKPRPASLRFGVQVAAVAIGLWSLAPSILVFQGLLPLPVDRLLTALLWLWFINLFNFMDGIDGITAVETVAIGGGLAAVWALAGRAPEVSFAAAVPAAAALGFLYWNWAPARIFLGDVGSVPLGYLLGWLLIGAAGSGFWAAALILPLYYLTDASWTLARRLIRREKLWLAHREHFYQRAVQRGFSHAAVASRILLCNVVLVGLALLAAAAHSRGGGVASPVDIIRLSLLLALLAVIILLFILARQRAPAAPPRQK
ncbi:MAG: glycosyltransferase family 4 protein [Kiloniellaceae bacterium]